MPLFTQVTVYVGELLAVISV